MICSNYLAASQMSSIATLETEQGAAADNACRDGAPGGAGLFAGAPRPGTPTALKALGPGILARRSADRNAGLTEPRPLRGASRRSIPHLGKRKKGKALASRLIGRGR